VPDSGPSASRGAAQPDSSEGAGALFVAPALLDLSSINQQLRSSGYVELASASALVGVEGVGVFGDVYDDRHARFDDVLADPKRGASLNYGGVLGSLTLAMDWRVGRGNERNRTFFTLGTRVGGLYGPTIGDGGLAWNARASSSPAFALAGGFIALAIGFGVGPARSATNVAAAPPSQR
jgi:hypothetical protein